MSEAPVHPGIIVEKEPKNIGRKDATIGSGTTATVDPIVHYGKLGKKALATVFQGDNHVFEMKNEAGEQGDGDQEDQEAKQQKMLKEAKDFTSRYGRIFSVFAKDSSIKYAPGPGRTFSFNAKNCTVNVPTNWFNKGEYSEYELLFANLHELGHFLDMQQNPEAFLQNFERMQTKAKELARDYKQKHPKDTHSRSYLENFYANELHSLYNVLDDIYVNNTVRNKTTLFNTGSGKKAIASLYDKLGFKEPDQTQRPLHTQMIHALLRDEMIGDVFGKSIVSPEVEEKLNVRTFGAKNIPDYVNRKLKENLGTEDGRKAKDPANRYKCIQAIIEPIFLELLEKYLEEAAQEPPEPPENQPQGQDGPDEDEGDTGEQEPDDSDDSEDSDDSDNSDGSGNSGDSDESDESDESNESGGSGEDGEENEEDSDSEDGQEGQSGQSEKDGKRGKKSKEDSDPFEESSKNSIKDFMDDAPDENAIKDILKAMQEAKERESMTKEEKEAEAQREYDEEHGISEGARKLIEEVMEAIAPLREKMLEIWKHLVGKAIGYKRVVVNRQTRGRLDVNRGLIREWPNIEDDTRKGEVKNHPIYERLGYEREVIDQPERIEVSVLVDVSGSMGKGNRIEIARNAAALLVYSLQDFNEQLRYTNRSKLVADSEVRLYSYGEITDGPAKGFLKGQSREDETTQIINMISKIGAYGLTNDVPSLESILNSMSPEDKQKIKEMKLKKIVFEITDGTPDSISDSKKAIEALVNEGVIVVGFKIGGTINDGDGQNFDKIWKHDSAGQRGIFIGEKLNRLPEEMMKQLADLLSDIKI